MYQPNAAKKSPVFVIIFSSGDYGDWLDIMFNLIDFHAPINLST